MGRIDAGRFNRRSLVRGGVGSVGGVSMAVAHTAAAHAEKGRAVLFGEPDVLSMGLAAEHIVCADLLLAGHRAYLTNQNCAYDVVADTGDRLVRVQVKSTGRARVNSNSRNSIAYRFNCRARRSSGFQEWLAYEQREFDVFALVAIDIWRVAYVPVGQHVPHYIHVRVPGRPGVPRKNAKTFHDCTFDAAISPLQRDLDL